MQRRVFSTEEVDANCLTLEGSHIESPQHVTRCLVEVRESAKSRQHRVTGIANLHLQLVERGSGGCFSRIDLQPETQRRGGRTRWNGDLLEERIRVRSAIAVEPCIERSGSWCLAG